MIEYIVISIHINKQNNLLEHPLINEIRRFDARDKAIKSIQYLPQNQNIQYVVVLRESDDQTGIAKTTKIVYFKP